MKMVSNINIKLSVDDVKDMIIKKLKDEGYQVSRENIKFDLTKNEVDISDCKLVDADPIKVICTHRDKNGKDAFGHVGNTMVCKLCGYIKR